MITWWALDRTIPMIVFKTIVVIAVGQLVFELAFDPRFELRFELPSANAIALATALAIFIAGRRQRLHVWLNWRWLQFLSRISYSLYLIHFPVSHMLTTAGWAWCGNSPTAAQATAILLSSLAASLLAGYALYVLVEAPSVRWAARMKQRPNVGAP
jgi:peptidoglycan/LPS O-acetylase OafA/YrhL